MFGREFPRTVRAFRLCPDQMFNPFKDSEFEQRIGRDRTVEGEVNLEKWVTEMSY